jgi:hypothetical protein
MLYQSADANEWLVVVLVGRHFDRIRISFRRT